MVALTLVVPTGRLLEDALALLRRSGFLVGAAGIERPAEERSLILPGDDGLRVVVAKPADVPTYVERGAADVGIVGKDILLEREHDIYEMVDLGFGACRGVVALPAGLADRWDVGTLLRIATRYPRITARFFETQPRPVEIVALHGAVELAPRIGLADGIMDLVVTGATLRANLLTEVAEVFRSTARLVVNRASLRTKASRLRPLLDEVAAQAAAGG
ncbi:MAG TPA: ATP phosphoribosyltransferase [bacterium]|nr:ATP phosphoribosyltransferase [bacterium]